MAPRVLTISDIRVTNFTAGMQRVLQLPCCSFELGMARVSTTTVRCELLTMQDTSVRAREADGHLSVCLLPAVLCQMVPALILCLANTALYT